MKVRDTVRNIVLVTSGIVGIGGLAGLTIRTNIDKPLTKVHPLLAKYDKNGDNELNLNESFDLLINEIDKNKNGILEEELAENDKLFENRGFLPPHNIMRSMSRFYEAERIMIMTRSEEQLKTWLEQRNKTKQ